MKRACLAGMILSAAAASWVQAKDIAGVLPASLDQPRIYAYISLSPGGPPLEADFGGDSTINIEAFFDTGASGVLLSNNTAGYLGLEPSTFGGQDVIFSDVGAVGSDDFYVSNPVYISLAPYHPDSHVDDLGDLSAYSQSFGPIRTQMGPIGAESDPVLGDLDVFGIPLMQNKVVVMDPKPVNTFLDTMRTYLYDPGTPFNSGTPATDPGIPLLNDSNSYHVRLSKADFSGYTQLTPSGAPGPTIKSNPFVGPDPTQTPGPGDPSPITLEYGGASPVTGSFLLDTGAAASFISTGKAASLGVSYQSGTQGTDDPILVHNGSPIEDQFSLTIGGIGGTTVVAGFFLDAMTLPTVEGESDPSKNLKFLGAPVLVSDITLETPDHSSTLTLDGILGMNFFVASALLIEDRSGDPNQVSFPIIAGLAPGFFDWVVYDDDNSMLGLQAAPFVAVGYKQWFGGFDGGFEPTDPFWDIDGTENWDFGGDTFQNGDAVSFGDFIFDYVFDTITVTQPVSPSNMSFPNSLESEGGVHYTIQGLPITGTGGLVKTGTGIVTLLNSNTFTGQTDVQNGTLELVGSQNIGPVVVRGGGSIIMSSSQTFQGLNVASGYAKLTAGGNKVLNARNLEVDGAGKLDLTDNRMILDKVFMNMEDLRDQLASAYNGGDWDGPGLTSSTVAASGIMDALGYADNARLGLSSFGGVAVDSDSILVRYTLAGDANLDGLVDIRDMQALAPHWLEEDMFWYFGDFDYNGTVNEADLAMIAMNWQGNIATAAPPLSFLEALSAYGLPSTGVPEPASLAAIALAMLGASVRPRRRRGSL